MLNSFANNTLTMTGLKGIIYAILAAFLVETTSYFKVQSSSNIVFFATDTPCKTESDAQYLRPNLDPNEYGFTPSNDVPDVPFKSSIVAYGNS